MSIIHGYIVKMYLFKHSFWFVSLSTVLLLTWCTYMIHAADSGALVAVETEEDEDGDGEVTDDIDEVGEDVLDPNMDSFSPSNDWQTVKPGQSIPAGLHVRLNLETGAREAKLLDEEDGSGPKTDTQDKIKVTDGSRPTRLQMMKQAIEQAIQEGDYKDEKLSQDPLYTFWKYGDKQGMASTKKDQFTRDELKQALKKFKATKNDNQDEQKSTKKNTFRSMDELKKDLKELDLSVRTDPEIIYKLLKQYKGKDTTVPEKETILTELEYYVHQIDNAIEFADIGGIVLLVKEMNNTETSLRGLAAFVIGSAVQSNIKVQIEAVEEGALHHMSRMLAIESNNVLQNRALYGISNLLRNFPFAQQKFVELGGVHTLTQILMKDNGDIVNLKIKAITLMNDLMMERITTEEQSKSEDSTERTLRRLEQYNLVKLPEALQEQGWCELVPNLLSLSEHDSREKTITAIATMMEICKGSFIECIPSLRTLKSEYSAHAEKESTNKDTDWFFRDLLKKINDILLQLERYERKIDL